MWLFGNRVFTEVIKLISPLIALISSQNRNFDAEISHEKKPCEREGRDKQIKEGQFASKPPETGEECDTGPHLRPSEENNPVCTLISDFQPP
jgi:hypothetical protein